jgi:hypothetical protein
MSDGKQAAHDAGRGAFDVSMNLSQIRDGRPLFFVPGTPEYYAPWMLGLVLLPILAALGTPFISVPQVALEPRQAVALVALCGLLLVTDAALLWTNIRSQFVTWSAGWPATVVTTLLLAAVYWGAATTTLVVHGTLQFALRPGEAELGSTLYGLGHGLASLAAILFLSAIWKFEDPGYANVRQARRTAVLLLDRLGDGSLAEVDFPAVKKALQAISTEAGIAAARTSRAFDRQVLSNWGGAAHSFLESYRDHAPSDFDLGSEETNDHKAIKATADALRRSDAHPRSAR